MNFKKIILHIFMLGVGVFFTGCETSVSNNGIENISKENSNLVVITEENKNKSIEITDTPITIRNEVFGFEVELGEERSGGSVFPQIRGHGFSEFSGGHYTFELDGMLDVVVFEFLEKNDFIEKELDPSDENDNERIKSHYGNDLNTRKIISKSGKIPKYERLGYKGDTEYGIFGENNRYYFSINDYSFETIHNNFKNNTCIEKSIYHEVYGEYFNVIVCPNALTDIFNGGFKIFDVE